MNSGPGPTGSAAERERGACAAAALTLLALMNEFEPPATKNAG